LENLKESDKSENICRSEDIRTDLTETGCEGVDWMHLAQQRYQWRTLVSTIINLRVP